MLSALMLRTLMLLLPTLIVIVLRVNRFSWLLNWNLTFKWIGVRGGFIILVLTVCPLIVQITLALNDAKMGVSALDEKPSFLR